MTKTTASTTRPRVRVPGVPDRRVIAGGAIFLWVALSPWVWGFAGSHSAVANHVALIFGFGPLALIMVNLRAAALVTLLSGAWLVVSPWALGYAGDHAAWLNELVTGLSLVVLCASAAGVRVPRLRRQRLAARRVSRVVAAGTGGSHS